MSALVPDIPCTCITCGMVYADARLRRLDAGAGVRSPEDFLDPDRANSFSGIHCRLCHGTEYRLLSGPLFVPRAAPLLPARAPLPISKLDFEETFFSARKLISDAEEAASTGHLQSCAAYLKHAAAVLDRLASVLEDHGGSRATHDSPGAAGGGKATPAPG